MNAAIYSMMFVGYGAFLTFLIRLNTYEARTRLPRIPLYTSVVSCGIAYLLILTREILPR